MGISFFTLMFLCYVATAYYLNNKKNELAALLVKSLNDQYSGEITVEDISLDQWTAFWSPAINLEKLEVLDTNTVKKLYFRADLVNINLSIKDLIKGRIQINDVRLQDGEILLDNYTPLTPQEELELPPILDSVELNKKIKNEFLEKNTDLELVNMSVQIRHLVKNKLFKFHVDRIHSELNFEEEKIGLSTDLDVELDALGFNLDKGIFINGADVEGSFNASYSVNEGQLSVEPFDLSIDDQDFKTKIELNFKGWGAFDIQLENAETDFKPTVGLLTEKIQKGLSIIELNEPFYTRTHLIGNFVYRANPFVEVFIETNDNSVLLNDQIEIEELNIDGKFVNRIFEDERADSESKKNFRLELADLHGRYMDFDLQINDFLMSNSPDEPDYLNARIHASGKPEDLNDVMEDQMLSFNGGSFKIDTHIQGKVDEIDDIIAASDGIFTLDNTTITNNDNQVSIPVSKLELDLDKDLASIKALEVRLNSRDQVLFTGEIENLSTLFNEDLKKKARSKLNIYSKNVVWEDFLKLFDIAKNNRPEEKPELVLQDALKDLYSNFDPSFSVNLDNFHFGNIDMTTFRVGIHFDDKNTLVLDESSFGLQGGSVQISSQIDLSNDNEVPINAQLSGSADVEILNQIFNLDQLDLEGGNFKIDGQLSGDLLRLDEIPRTSKSQLQIVNTIAVLKPQEIRLPVTNMHIALDRDNAILNELQIDVGTEDQITFRGQIQNISTLLLKKNFGKVVSDLEITSERLVWEDYLRLFGEETATQNNEPANAEELIEAERRLKQNLRNIYTTLDPRVTVAVKDFSYEELLSIKEFQTALSFRDQETLKLENMSFTYDNSTNVSISGVIDISDQPETVVDMSIQANGNAEQLNEVLNNDTFLFQEGIFEVNAFLSGDFAQLDSLVAHSDSRLLIKNSNIYHQPSEVNIPLSTFEVELADNKADLKNFTIDLESGDQINISGKVSHISDLIFDVPPEASKSSAEMNIYSEKLRFEDFQSLFALTEADTTSSQASSEDSQTAIKPTIRDVYNKFRPGLVVQIDEFDLNGLPVTNLKTGFHFVDQDLIYLEKSGFNFYDGSVTLDAHLDISIPGTTYFAFGFGTDKIDLEKLLKAFDYFGIDAIKSADRIGGLVSLETEFEGLIDDEEGMLSESLKGNISFNLEETQIAGFEPMIKSGKKIFRKERLEDIRFSPISNTMFLEANKLEIPLMEIQSSAFELFIAGHLGFEDVDTNLWIGFPLDNLKSRDIKNVPDKEGYIAAGRKVYVEAKSHEKKGIKYVLHLNPKKYYKGRDLMDSYRTEIRQERKEIRDYKRESRKSEREAKKTGASD